ncbi:Hypothetical predicted protein [Olea europaea subsp. europaea]|uniref:Uncharacterized protein n=1 Tax=Olea europaea subsp. europaea TaxID=158383 RepID=A0A8S0V3C5_OLEEU|nr:Hypothetical predicted protein [Olea europaea subsp. europaea]
MLRRLSLIMLFGARVEGELVMNLGNKIPEESLLVPVIGSSLTNVVIVAPTKEHAERKKWKPDRLVKGVYSDWLDDFLRPHNSPRNEEI